MAITLDDAVALLRRCLDDMDAQPMSRSKLQDDVDDFLQAFAGERQNLVPPVAVESGETAEEAAEKSAATVVKLLTTPVNGVPSMTVIKHDNAVRLIKAALLSVWEVANRP